MREKQPVHAALHLISRQHEKAVKEPRVSLTVISSSALPKPDRSRPFLTFVQKKQEAGSRVVWLGNTFPHQLHQMPHAHKIQINQKYAKRDFTKHRHLLPHRNGPTRELEKNVRVQVHRRTTNCPPTTFFGTTLATQQ